MEFKHLECFIKVVDKKSFSKASEALYISQSAVSNHIQKLESYLKVKLINRNGREISMTEEGKILYSYANELLNLKEKALSELNANRHLGSESIAINSSTIPAQYIVPEIIKEFKKDYPTINMELAINSSREVALDILSGRINIGFVGSEYKNKMLEYVDFYDDELVLISPKGLKFPSEIISINELKNLDLIIREDGSGTRRILEQELLKNGKNLSLFKSISEFEDNQAIKKMVELGGGIAFVSELDIRNELELGLLSAYKVKDLALQRKFKMVYAKDRHFSPIEIAFKDFVLANCL